MGLNFSPSTVFHMDNLDALRGMNSETVDLIATDPPFNTGRNRESVGGKYVDQWRWGALVHENCRGRVAPCLVCFRLPWLSDRTRA